MLDDICTKGLPDGQERAGKSLVTYLGRSACGGGSSKVPYVDASGLADGYLQVYQARF